MALRPLIDEESSNAELPWVNEYVESYGSVNDAFLVVAIKKSPKGYLILTDRFKGFVFGKSAMAGFLTEALEAWVSNSTINYPLFAIATEGGKISLSVDDELAPSTWTMETKNKSWTQKVKKKQESGSNLPRSNPFLPTPPPTMSFTKKTSKGSAIPLDTIGH